MPGRNEARVFSLLAIAVALIVCVWSLLLGFRGEAFMGRPLGGDFVQFYVAGKILNQFDAWRIYDLKLAVDLQHSTVPTMARLPTSPRSSGPSRCCRTPGPTWLG